MSYMDRLKAEFSEKRHPGELTKLTKAPSVSFVSDPSRQFPEIDPGLDGAPADPAETSGHWLIIQAERAERWFSSPATRAELAERYPGAVLVALPESRSENARPATQEEADEIRHLVAAMAVQEAFTPEEQEEALSNALRDPQATLRCFRALLDEGKRS